MAMIHAPRHQVTTLSAINGQECRGRRYWPRNKAKGRWFSDNVLSCTLAVDSLINEVGPNTWVEGVCSVRASARSRLPSGRRASAKKTTLDRFGRSRQVGRVFVECPRDNRWLLLVQVPGLRRQAKPQGS